MTRSKSRASLLLLSLAALLALILPAAADAQSQAAGVRLEMIIDGDELGRTVGLVAAPGAGDRFYVVQQAGTIVILDRGELLDEPFLDISRKVTCCENERGLLGLAFHPQYRDNGYFYVVYSDRQSRTVVERYSVSADPDVADRTSAARIIRWDQPEPPHNGGAIAFGPDGYLYLGSGDGGTRDAAQNLESVLGAILRIDVDSAFPYAIPEDNPFANDPEARPEILVYGLRNPWKFSIDRETGDLFIGDVGAAQFEEINLKPADSPGGENFGWPILEGPRCVVGEEECQDESLVAPIISYPHKVGTCNSVTGGYRYRGPSVPTLPRFYVFADFCRGDIWGARRNAAGAWVVNELLQSGLLVTSFTEDAEGNLYLVHFRGDVYRLLGQSLFASDFESGDLLDWTRSRGDIAAANTGLRRSEHALEVPAGRGKAFVSSKHPSAETSFKLSFDLNVNRINLANGSAEILRLAGSRRRGHVRLHLEQEDNRYFLAVLTLGEGGGFVPVGRTVVPRGRTVRIELDWLAASASGATDGQLALSKNGKPRVAATNLDNHASKVGTVTLGFPSGSNGAGSYLVDNYESTP